MRGDRVSYDFTNWANTTTGSRLCGAQTPRNKNKLYQQSDNNKKSVSPLRYTTVSHNPMVVNDRISTSPLRRPLQSAINNMQKCFPTRDRSIDKSSTSRRILGKSSRRQQNSFIQIVKKISYDDQLSNKNVKAHSETLKFIKKYFDPNYIIPTEEFISKILQEYGNMWDNQNLEQLLEDFTYKVNEMFGVDGIDPKALVIATKNDGMLGLIMNIFKQLKDEESTRNSTYTSFSRNPQVMSINKSFQQRLNYNENIQNIKNVVQQFMQSMYQCMQTEIYNKFTIQMRRMVLKYRQAEKIIKKVNEKITTHADLFDLEDKLRKQKKFYEEKIKQIEKNQHRVEVELSKEKEINNQLKNSKIKMQEENRKLKESMQKLQSALISKALQSGSTNNSTIPSSTSQLGFCPDPSLSRRTTFADRTSQYANTNLNMSNLPPSQPFQIKIDTHIVQKQLAPPTTYTTTTFGAPVQMSSLSPMKKEQTTTMNKQNGFLQGRYSYSPYGNKFYSSRLI